MDFNDGLLENINNFDLDDIQFSPCYPDSEKDSFCQKEKEFSSEASKDLVYTLEQGLTEINQTEATMFPAYTVGDYTKPTPSSTESASNNMDSWGSQIMDGESVCLNADAIDNINLLELTADDPDPPMLPVPVTSHSELKTVNPSAVHYYRHQVIQTEVKMETEDNSNSLVAPSSARPSRQRRKSVQTSRNVQDSPLTFHAGNEETIDLQTFGTVVKTEYKPFALTTLNGTEQRSRNVSASTSSYDAASPAPSKCRASKSSDERKKRKYEEEDDNDPSVKNAKAAKLNRDKKKQQMQELQKKVKDMSSENRTLTEDNCELRNKYEQMEQQYSNTVTVLQTKLQEEMSKNAANSKQKVTMLDLIRNVVSVVNPAPQVICVTERLAATPMPDPSELENIRNMPPIPQPSGMDTYLTFKEPHND